MRWLKWHSFPITGRDARFPAFSCGIAESSDSILGAFDFFVVPNTRTNAVNDSLSALEVPNFAARLTRPYGIGTGRNRPISGTKPPLSPNSLPIDWHAPSHRLQRLVLANCLPPHNSTQLLFSGSCQWPQGCTLPRRLDA